MLKRYFLSRMPFFTPETARHCAISSENECELLTADEIGQKKFLDGGPSSFSEIAEADTHQSRLWPQNYVHAVGGEKTLIACNPNSNRIIDELVELAKENNFSHLGDLEYWKDAMSDDRPEERQKPFFLSLRFALKYDGIIWDERYIVPLSIAIAGSYYCGTLNNFKDKGPSGKNFLQYVGNRDEIVLENIPGMPRKHAVGSRSDYLSACPFEILQPRQGYPLKSVTDLPSAQPRRYRETWNLP